MMFLSVWYFEKRFFQGEFRENDRWLWLFPFSVLDLVDSEMLAPTDKIFLFMMKWNIQWCSKFLIWKGDIENIYFERFYEESAEHAIVMNNKARKYEEGQEILFNNSELIIWFEILSQFERTEVLIKKKINNKKMKRCLKRCEKIIKQYMEWKRTVLC